MPSISQMPQVGWSTFVNASHGGVAPNDGPYKHVHGTTGGGGRPQRGARPLRGALELRLAHGHRRLRQPGDSLPPGQAKRISHFTYKICEQRIITSPTVSEVEIYRKEYYHGTGASLLMKLS